MPQRLLASQPRALALLSQDELPLLADLPSKGGGEFSHLSDLWGSSFRAQCQVSNDSAEFSFPFPLFLGYFCPKNEKKKARGCRAIHGSLLSVWWCSPCLELLPGAELGRLLVTRHVHDVPTHKQFDWVVLIDVTGYLEGGWWRSRNLCGFSQDQWLFWP